MVGRPKTVVHYPTLWGPVSVKFLLVWWSCVPITLSLIPQTWLTRMFEHPPSPAALPGDIERRWRKILWRTTILKHGPPQWWRRRSRLLRRISINGVSPANRSRTIRLGERASTRTRSCPTGSRRQTYSRIWGSGSTCILLSVPLSLLSLYLFFWLLSLSLSLNTGCCSVLSWLLKCFFCASILISDPCLCRICMQAEACGMCRPRPALPEQ